MQFLIAILLGGFITIAHAQDSVQGADPKFMQHALAALQAQRNRALDEAAAAEAQLSRANSEISDLKKQLEDLKKK